MSLVSILTFLLAILLSVSHAQNVELFSSAMTGLTTNNDGWILTGGNRCVNVEGGNNADYCLSDVNNIKSCLRMRGTCTIQRMNQISTAGYNNIKLKYFLAHSSNKILENGDELIIYYSCTNDDVFIQLIAYPSTPFDHTGKANYQLTDIRTENISDPACNDNNDGINIKFENTGTQSGDHVYLDQVSITAQIITSDPTETPTKSPTINPTKTPTKFPTINPTKMPTTGPTKSPTTNPTKSPTTYPTINPTKTPTKSPSTNPSRSPTVTTNSPTTSPSARYSDDNVLSFDGDEGWKIYIDKDKHIDVCQVPSTCQTGNFYGPFESNIKYFLQRRFECFVHSLITVSYKVISCDVIGSGDISQIYIDNLVGAKTTIQTTPKIGESPCNVTANDPNVWLIQTEPQQISETFSNPLYDVERFAVKIKNYLKSGKSYIYGITVDCTPSGLNLTDSDSIIYQHEEYCVSGFSDNTINGEYIIKVDSEEDPIFHRVNDVNTIYFEKNDHRGDAFLYQVYDYNDIGNDHYQWVIGPILGQKTNIKWICQYVSNITTTIPDLLEIGARCSGDVDVNGDIITIQENECVDAHTIIGSSASSFILMVVLVLLSFILSMICYCCCQLFCCRKHKTYKKVYDKDIEDIEDIKDIDF